jgi:hypothetical protein
MHGQDPGWSTSRRDLLVALIPGFGVHLELARVRRGETHGLVAVRMAFVNYLVVLALCIVAVVLVVRDSCHCDDNATTIAAIVVSIIGAGALFASLKVGPPLLPCSDDAALGRAYVSRFFLRIACANLASLVGFVAAFYVHAWWLYPLGLLFGVIGLARAAPTRAHVEDEQAALALSGCTRSLVSALAVLPPDVGTSRRR